jgi:hypothetical protein
MSALRRFLLQVQGLGEGPSEGFVSEIVNYSFPFAYARISPSIGFNPSNYLCTGFSYIGLGARTFSVRGVAMYLFANVA